MNTAVNKDLNTPIWQLTIGEFLELQESARQPKQEVVSAPDEKFVYGIPGIAKLLVCSKTMVHEYRRQGWIEPAIKQIGRKIVC
ncbi:MAG: DUF3853 family protein, partial [Bacteroidales bacterium]|nr:DUF3853 family protein [Bacteroidales bacterium]